MKIGLALSGGGVRGAAHLGVIKYIEELGLGIDYISGTSVGSIIASLYSAGYTVDEMVEEAVILNNSPKTVDYDYLGIIFYIFALIFRKNTKLDGIVKGKKFKKILYDLLAKKNVYEISDVKIPLAIPAVDINNSVTKMYLSRKIPDKKVGKIEYINDVILSDVIRASCSLPVVFKPERLEGKKLVDGGLASLVPVNILKEMGADKVIAVNVGYSGNKREYINDIFDIAGQSIDIMSYKISTHDLANADLVINVSLDNVGILQLDKIPECINIGYKTAKDKKFEIINSLLKK